MKKVLLAFLMVALVLMVVALMACASPPASTPAPAPPPSEPATEPPPAPTDDTGEQYKQAPDFEAIDSQGRSIMLSDFVGKKNLVIVINRGFG